MYVGPHLSHFNPEVDGFRALSKAFNAQNAQLHPCAELLVESVERNNILDAIPSLCLRPVHTLMRTELSIELLLMQT